jgi:CubicO group peptidase (beta-lactamase class C family)
MLRTRALFCFTSAAVVMAAPVHAQQHPALAGLDAYIEGAIRDWQVPGLAVAVVRNDSVIFARGYGVREQGAAGAVDAHTLFPIASTTKAMTVAALGLLVDEGRLRWDDPVVTHLPGFMLADPYVTRELTVRDLLTHRSGVSRSDNLWIATPVDRAEILRRARFLPRAAGFREQYGYNNIMYLTAGELAGVVAGSSWDELLETRLFRPLGMTRSTTRMSVLATRDNVAASHVRVDGRVVSIPRRDYDHLGGAGAAFSSAHDLAQWVRMHLAGGVYGGQRLLAEPTLREMHTPQVVMRADSVNERLFPTTNFRAYGLGWYLRDHHGRKIVHHSGLVNWTGTQVAMVPSEGLGVVVISNLGASDVPTSVMYRVIDAFLGVPPRDLSAEYLVLQQRANERTTARAREVEAARVRGTRPSLPLDRYAGTYTDSVFGEMRLTREGDRLVLHYAPDYVADLEHWHHDTFRARWRRTGFGQAFVSFALDAAGTVASMQVEGYGGFARAAAR